MGSIVRFQQPCAKGVAKRLAWAGLLMALLASPPAALAQSPRLVIYPAGQVSDSGPGPIIATFDVSVFFDYPAIQCPTNNPNCNAKTVSACVDYHTVGETATSDQDFRAKSGRLSKTLTFQPGGDDQSVGTIDIEVIGDSVVEGMESFKVVITNPSGEPCVNEASLHTFEARAFIVDGGAKKPDLTISDLKLMKGCQMQLTVKNAGSGPVPESAYDRQHGVAIQMQREGQPWGGIRLVGVDPAKKLMTPGASVTYVWFPNAANLKLKPGANVMTVTVDKNNALAESAENNNTRTENLACRR